ncbi:MAG: PEGA domain-containing protein [Terriglobia bacterium]
MSWICPTCRRDVALWQAECPHCAGTPSQEGSPPEEATAPPEATPIDTRAESAQTPSSMHVPENAAATRSVFRGSSSIPWGAYPVMGLAVVALAILLWPSDQVGVRVQSEPPGAVVLLDDKRAGKAPLELTGLKHGYRYRIRVELEGYEPFQQTFLAQPQEKPWTITLERAYDPLLDGKVVQELVGQIGASAGERLFSHELADALFTVNPLIEQNPWLTERTWSQIFQQVVKTNFDGDSQEFLRHLRGYKAELARGNTSKQAWYQHLQACEKVCRPVVTEVFKRHIRWLRRSGFTVIYFPLNQHRLTDEDTARVGQFVAEHDLAQDRSRQVLLVGRASRIGGQQYNLELSRKRVESVTQELAAQLPDADARLRTVHLGFEPPQISPAVAEFLRLDPSLNQVQHNQSVMLILSEPLPKSPTLARLNE